MFYILSVQSEWLTTRDLLLGFSSEHGKTNFRVILFLWVLRGNWKERRHILVLKMVVYFLFLFSDLLHPFESFPLFCKLPFIRSDVLLVKHLEN